MFVTLEVSDRAPLEATMSTPHHPVAIIGGGLGGLTAARVLHVNGIESAVFDLESGPEARTQGGMLDIHEENGQEAIRAAGLHDEFREIIHEGGQAMRLVGPDGTVRVATEDQGDGGRPEVDRGDLRGLLLNSLPDGTVHWRHKATGARALDDGRHEVTFADGSALTTDLLIGADGAWSRIRPLLSDAEPAYTGISFVESDLHEADTRHPRSAASSAVASSSASATGAASSPTARPTAACTSTPRSGRTRAGSTPSTSPTTPPPKPRSSPTSTAGTRACAASSPTRRPLLRAASTPCPSDTAGSGPRRHPAR